MTKEELKESCIENIKKNGKHFGDAEHIFRRIAIWFPNMKMYEAQDLVDEILEVFE